jgi:hypothetical protein
LVTKQVLRLSKCRGNDAGGGVRGTTRRALLTTYLNKNSKRNIHFVSCKTCHPLGIPAAKK